MLMYWCCVLHWVLFAGGCVTATSLPSVTAFHVTKQHSFLVEHCCALYFLPCVNNCWTSSVQRKIKCHQRSACWCWLTFQGEWIKSLNMFAFLFPLEFLCIACPDVYGPGLWMNYHREGPDLYVCSFVIRGNVHSTLTFTVHKTTNLKQVQGSLMCKDGTVNEFSISIRQCLLVHCFRFLSMLEEEVYGASSPIWNSETIENPLALTLPGTTTTVTNGTGKEIALLVCTHTLMTT